MKPIFIAYYTKNTGYEQEVENLRESLLKFDLEHDIQGIPNLGDWNKNTHYKPKFIKKMLLKHNKPVVYIDADAVICLEPIYFDDLICDIAVPKITWSEYRTRSDKVEILSGTLYFTPKAINLVNKWIVLCDKQPIIWDQKLLAKLLNDTQYLILPDEYCVIFDSMRKIKNPVIKHMQASRRFKREVKL